jgi:hypothetical protein
MWFPSSSEQNPVLVDSCMELLSNCTFWREMGWFLRTWWWRKCSRVVRIRQWHFCQETWNCKKESMWKVLCYCSLNYVTSPHLLLLQYLPRVTLKSSDEDSFHHCIWRPLVFHKVSYVVLYGRFFFFSSPPQQNLQVGVKTVLIALCSSFTVWCWHLVPGIESLGWCGNHCFYVLFSIVYWCRMKAE